MPCGIFAGWRVVEVLLLLGTPPHPQKIGDGGVANLHSVAWVGCHRHLRRFVVLENWPNPESCGHRVEGWHIGIGTHFARHKVPTERGQINYAEERVRILRDGDTAEPTRLWTK